MRLQLRCNNMCRIATSLARKKPHDIDTPLPSSCLICTKNLSFVVLSPAYFILLFHYGAEMTICACVCLDRCIGPFFGVSTTVALFFLRYGRSRSKAQSLHEKKLLVRKLLHGRRWSHAAWQIITTNTNQKHKTSLSESTHEYLFTCPSSEKEQVPEGVSTSRRNKHWWPGVLCPSPCGERSSGDDSAVTQG